MNSAPPGRRGKPSAIPPPVPPSERLKGMLAEALRGGVDVEKLVGLDHVAPWEPSLKVVYDAVLEEMDERGHADAQRVADRIRASGNGSADGTLGLLADLSPIKEEDQASQAQTPTVVVDPPGPSVPATTPRDSGPTAADVAEAFLAARGTPLKFWRGVFYTWTGTHYREIPGSDLNAEIIGFLQEFARKSAGTRAAGEVTANLKALVFIPSNVEPPVWILPGGISPAGNSIVPMENGIFDVDKYFEGKWDEALTPHNPNLFSLHALPFPFTAEAECPIFEDMMADNLPDPDYRRLAQEWFGYNLVPDTSYEAFLLAPGEAGSGKTAVCTVLRALLGRASVSSVPLEAFSASRTFPLAAMVGKLANIAEEIGDCDKAAEGLLKQLVTGSPITIERKFGDPFDLVSRARLTFATNVLPRFADRTNGIWRRMLLLPFTQVVPEESRDRRFLSVDWWTASGELPGIFLWALEGLQRLRTYGRFTDPPECKAMRDSYKRDSNPAGTFLRDNCEYEATSTFPSNRLYKAYAAYAKAHGHRPLAEVQFAKEVRRTFPLAEKGENAVYLPDGERARLWYGVRFIGKEPYGREGE
jgi:P4 family phage/plasmid primase-like protien